MAGFFFYIFNHSGYQIRYEWAEGGSQLLGSMVAEMGIVMALLFALAGSGADIFRTNTFHILGRYIWSPYLLITVSVFIGVLCLPFAVKGWSRRMKV